MESDSKKIVQFALVVTALLVAYLLHRGLQYIVIATGISNMMLLGTLPLSSVVAVLLSAAGYVYLMNNATAMTFLYEVHGELKKVVWPTRKETSLSTVVVVILVLITAVLLWGIDLFWSWSIRQIL